jgi:hypothetical protein
MKLYCQLGRYGDIMSLLPILYRDFQAGEKPSLMVAAEFKELLEGVSYVDVIQYEGPHYEIAKAVAQAKTLSTNVVCTQVNGPIEQVRDCTYAPAGQTGARATSYEKEMWRVSGNLQHWDDLLPLVIDRRDKKREEKLLRENDLLKRGKQKPLMLLALNSTSSPFPYADLLRELVTLKFGDTWRIMDLPKAERIYDLLAVYERAALLIAVDSAPLHLAWARRELPVFALTQDRPPNVASTALDKMLWYGSPWRPNHLWYCRYNGWPKRAMDMLDAIAMLNYYNPEYPVQVWSEYERRGSCVVVGNTLPVAVGMCGRDAAFILQDPKRRAPYLRDVLRMAMQRAQSDEKWIILRRPQSNFARHVKGDGPEPPYYAYRLSRSDEGDEFKPTADMFCATRRFWKDLLPEIPDFVMNNDHLWSEGLRLLFAQRGATDQTGCCTFVK